MELFILNIWRYDPLVKIDSVRNWSTVHVMKIYEKFTKSPPIYNMYLNVIIYLSIWGFGPLAKIGPLSTSWKSMKNCQNPPIHKIYLNEIIYLTIWGFDRGRGLTHLQKLAVLEVF